MRGDFIVEEVITKEMNLIVISYTHSHNMFHKGGGRLNNKPTNLTTNLPLF
jgi:hypothetical protein